MLCTFLRCFFLKLKFFFVNTFNCKRPVFNLLLWVLMHCISLHPIKVTVWMVQCCTVKCLQSSFFFFHWPHIAERLQSENKEWYCHLVEDWLTCWSPLIHPKHDLSLLFHLIPKLLCWTELWWLWSTVKSGISDQRTAARWIFSLFFFFYLQKLGCVGKIAVDQQFLKYCW